MIHRKADILEHGIFASGYLNVRFLNSIAGVSLLPSSVPGTDSGTAPGLSAISGFSSIRAFILFSETEPRLKMLATHPRAVIGQMTIPR